MKRVAGGLATLALVFGACGDSGEGGGATTSMPVTTTSTTTTVAATTAAAPTTTTLPPTTTTSPPVSVDGYAVVGVAADDVLNVRAGPGVEHEIVGTLPPDATGVVTTGEAADVWWEVESPEGWVNSAFLGLPGPLTVPFDERPCNQDAEGTATLPGGESDADHVLAIDYLAGADCERFVVTLGTGAFGYGPLWPFNPDPSLPAGTEVTAEFEVVTISLPRQVDLVRPTAVTGDYGDPLAFVVRREDGGLDVKVHFGRHVEARPFFLPNPARIVVDVVREPEAESDPLPIYDGFTAVLPIDPIGEGVVPPITIRGYGRPFEAQGDVELRELTDGPPGSGPPVDGATWDGIVGEVTSFGTGYRTSDWTLAWGAFEVTLVDVPEGGFYELFVGQVLPDDEGTMSGVYIPLAIIVDG